MAAAGVLALAALVLVLAPARRPVGFRWGDVDRRADRRRPLRRLASCAGIAGSARSALDRRVRARSERERASVDLPLALDLLGSALRAGQPPSAAAAAVARAIGGPVGEALRAVSHAAALGAAPEVAWQPLGRLTSAGAVARTAARTAESGTRLADELAELAADVRRRSVAAADTRVRRSGVLVVLPLGLCFLPAFILIGVVPIVIGIAGSLLR